MKLFFLGLLLLAASEANVIQGKGKAANGQIYTTCYDRLNYAGFYNTFIDYVDDLTAYSFNNVICSVEQSGMWMYYENKQYNNLFSGEILWVHGINFQLNFPVNFCGLSSSLKYGGNRYTWNEDSYTLYEGTYFAGNEFYGDIPSTTLTILNGAGSSLILSGTSAWTFYTGLGYTGSAYCFYPSTDTDVGSGSVLNFGIYPDLPSLGVPDNSFYSVRQGCFSTNVVRAEQMKAEERTANGAWGILIM